MRGGGNSQYSTVSNNNTETDSSSLSTYASETPVTTSEELVAAINSAQDGDTITLAEGNFTTYNVTGMSTCTKRLTFVGQGANTVWTIGNVPEQDKQGEYNGDYSFDGSPEITFKNMTLQSGTKDYLGFIRPAKTVVEDCIINGKTAYWGYTEAIFKNTVFNAPENDYALWDYSSSSMTFDGCTFNVSGKVVNVYVEAGNAGTSARKVVMKDCTINSSKANKSVLNIKNNTQAYDVEFIGTNTVTGLNADATTGSNLYQVEVTGNAGKACVVKIDGKTVWENGEKVEEVAQIGNEKYTSLASAVAAAKNGDIITLLKDTTLRGKIEINKKLTLDLGNYTVTYTGEGARAIYINSGADVTINATVNGGVTATLIALQVNNGGKLTINGGTYNAAYALASFSSVSETAETIINDGVFNGSVYTNGLNHNDFITFNGGTYTATTYLASGDKSTYVINDGTFTDTLEIDAGRLDINGGTFKASIDTSGNIDSPETNNNGSGAYLGNLVVCKPTGSSAEGYIGDVIVNINGGTFENAFANGETIVVADFGKEQAGVGDAKVAINDGVKVKGEVKVYASEGNQGVSLVISGGYYTADPSAYLDSNKVAVETTEPGYNYTIADKAAQKAEVVTATPDVALPSGLTGENQSAANTVSNALKAATDTVDGDGLTAAANTVANNNTVTTESGANQLNNELESDTATKDNTRIIIQTYMDIDITAIDTANKTLTLDITPMYRTIATTQANNDDIKVQGDTGVASDANAVKINEQKLIINKPVEITLPVPDSFDGTVYIQHKGYEYSATVQEANGSKTVTFTNPHGFSTFTISATSTAEAKIGGTSYMNFQDAVNAANDKDIIEIVKDGSYSATMSGSSRTITVKNGTAQEIKVKVNGDEQTLATGATHDFTYTRPSSGSGGSGVTNYNVTVNAATNGTVTADKKTAAKGATVTITATPSTGYVVDKITVVDKNGKDVAVTAKDGKYMFVMPDSAVTVSASFKADGSAGQENPFVDVKSGEYYYDAVLWAVKNGVTQGVDSTHFGPLALTTRGQMVTFLWRYAGSPEPASQTCPFTDVKAGSYYEKAVLWAVEQGISKGTSETTFSPDAVVLRGQAVTFLARLAGVKDDATATTHAFTDVTASDYFNNAVAWAAANNVTQGTSATTFSPNASCLRGQIVTFLYRAAQLK